MRVTQTCQPTFDENLMRAFAPHVKEHHLPELLDYLNEGSNTAFYVEGENALSLCLNFREQVRTEFATVQPYTLIHASDSNEAAGREYSVLFES